MNHHEMKNETAPAEANHREGAPSQADGAEGRAGDTRQQVETFLASSRSVEALFYYRTDEPDKNEGIQWLFAPTGSVQHQALDRAFLAGHRIRALVTRPFKTSHVDGDLAARAIETEVPFQS